MSSIARWRMRFTSSDGGCVSPLAMEDTFASSGIKGGLTSFDDAESKFRVIEGSQSSFDTRGGRCL